MLLSGPAGGVTGAVWIAEQCGHRDLITFDMGGTSTDIALVQGLTPRIGRETKVGDLTVRASSVDVRTVGAGGGSIAHVPELTRALRVGPQSAGADPGPAAYGKGGTEPTVTDANVVLGYLPAALAGGEITLDADAARGAVGKVAEAMGLGSPEAAAAGIVDIVNENMLGGLRLVSVQQGFDPRDFALVAFGGAGPLHANALGKLTGAWPVIVPPSPGVLSALGDATTSKRSESARTVLSRFADLTADGLAGILRELAAEAGSRLAGRACPRPTRPSPTRSTCATTGRASRSAWTSTPPGWTPRTRSAGWPPPSTPSTSGCSRSCWAPTTNWSTPGPRCRGRDRRWPR
jgi:N-methylhydantoinase A